MDIENNYNNYKVWSKYDATRKDGSVIKLRFQDYPWDKHKKEVIDFFIKYYIRDEMFHKAAGIFNNEESKTEYLNLFESFYDWHPPHVSICCIEDDSKSNDIVGMSLICEYKKGHTDTDDDNFHDNLLPKTTEMETFFRILKATPSDKLSEGYESYYEGRGISVRPDHRGLGIANEFMRLRKQICIDNNIQMTSAWMTSIATQKIAAKYNWKTFEEVSVEELAKQTGGTFETDVPTFKLMYTTKD